MTKRKEKSKSVISEKKRIELNLVLSEFEIPPMQDVLVIGKRAPIGPEAAKQMANSTAPSQFLFIPLRDNVIETILIRKKVLQLIPEEHLVPLIVEEAKKIIGEEDVIKIRLSVQVSVRKVIEI